MGCPLAHLIKQVPGGDLWTLHCSQAYASPPVLYLCVHCAVLYCVPFVLEFCCLFQPISQP